jgi:hypothetical protein
MAGSEEYDEEYDEEEELYESDDDEEAVGSGVGSRTVQKEPDAQEWVGIKSFPASVQSDLFAQLSKLRDQKMSEVRRPEQQAIVAALCAVDRYRGIA